MGVDTQKERPADIVSPTVIAYRLRDGEHVPLIERAVEGAAPVT